MCFLYGEHKLFSKFWDYDNKYHHLVFNVIWKNMNCWCLTWHDAFYDKHIPQIFFFLYFRWNYRQSKVLFWIYHAVSRCQRMSIVVHYCMCHDNKDSPEFKWYKYIKKRLLLTCTVYTMLNRIYLTIWTICAFRVLNPHQWSLSKQSCYKNDSVISLLITYVTMCGWVE